MVSNFRPLVALALLAALGAGLTRPAAAQVLVGGTNSSSPFPFGTYDPNFGSQSYTGEYQQIYSASSFGAAPITITQIAFASANDGVSSPESASYNFTFNVYSAATSAAAPSTNFAANKGTLLYTTTVNKSFSLSASGAFDLLIPTAFTYNPGTSDLLLDIVNNAGSGTTSGDLDSFVSSDGSTFAQTRTQRIYYSNGSTVGPIVDADGLRTSFTARSAAVVPEPSQTAALGMGVLGLAGLTLRARKRRSSVA